MTYALAFALVTGVGVLASSLFGWCLGLAWHVRHGADRVHPWAAAAPKLAAAVPISGGLVALSSLLPASPWLWLDGVCACEALGGLHVCPFHLGHAVTLVAVVSAAALLVACGRFGSLARAWQRARDVDHLATAAGPENDGVVYVDDGGRPLVFVAGLRRPRLFVERLWWSRLDSRERDVIAAHERAHIEARDPWLLVTLDLLLSICAPRARSRILADWMLATELRADAAAAEQDGDPVFVAEVLCRYARAAAPAGALGFGGADLDARVRSLLTERSAAFAGAGVGAAAAGPMPVPGLSLHVDFASAIFDPLERKQDVEAMKAATEAAEADVALAVAEAYYELVRGQGRLEIARNAAQESENLAATMESFAQAGEGLQSDASRMRVAQQLREGEVHAAQAGLDRAAARLAVLLRLEDPSAWFLRPAESETLPVRVVETDASATSLVDEALAARPEVRAHEATIAGAEASLRKERFGILLPTLAAAGSAGGFAADSAAVPGGLAGRGEVLLSLYWEVDNLGFGHVARARKHRSAMRRARADKDAALDTITLQVREAHADVVSARRRVDATHAAVAPARRAYDLDRQRIFEKQGLPVEVLQSLDALVEARTRHLDAIVDYNEAQHRLLHAMGRT